MIYTIIKFILAGAVVGVIGVAVYSGSGKSGSTVEQVAPVRVLPTESAVRDTDTPRSILGLLKRGGNYSCAFDEIGPTAKIIGGVAIYGERASGFLTSFPKDSSEPVDITFIRNSDFTYIWANPLSSAPKRGVKLISVPVSAGGEPKGSKIDFTRQFDFECAPLVVSESLFIPPSGVIFTTAQ